MNRRLVRLCVCAIVGFVALVAFEADSQASLNRVPGSWLWGPKPVWTDGTANPIFHPFSANLDTSRVTSARVSIEMDQETGNCKVRPALRWSHDGVTWDATIQAIDTTYTTAPSVTYGTSYVDLTTLGTPKNWVQFGVRAANQSGSAVEICNATLLVQPKDRP